MGNIQKINRYVKVTAGLHGHIGRFGEIPIRRLNATDYVDLRDGEIYEYQKHETKLLGDVCGAKQKLLDSINVNVKTAIDSGFFPRFLTLTVQENCLDREKIFYWFSLFRQLKIFVENFGTKYTLVLEHQKRGALHCHLIIYEPPKKFLPYAALGDAWTSCVGSTQRLQIRIEKIDNPLNIAAYLGKYITKEFLEVPKGKKVYTSSQGLRKPDKEIISEDELRELLVEKKIKVKKRIIDGEEMVVGYYW
jgi:hypothetical protein